MNAPGEHYVAAFRRGRELKQTRCFSGTKEACKETVRRMNRMEGRRRLWRVVSPREPLVRIGQGDSAREISEGDSVLARPVPWVALFLLWQFFAVLAYLWDCAVRH